LAEGGIVEAGGRKLRPATRFDLVSVVILTTAGETRFTTFEKLAASSWPRATGVASRLSSMEDLEEPVAEAPTSAPARAKRPRAA
jgi:hypothetical protein